MAVVLEFKSRTAQVLKDQQKVIQQAKELPKGYKETAKEAANAERAAKKLIQATLNPQEKYNQKLKETANLLATGRLNQDQARRAVALHAQELRKASEHGTKAFGAGAVRQLAAYAAGFVSISAASRAVLDIMRSIREERERSAQGVIEAHRAMGGLAQLSAGDKQKLGILIGEAKATYAEGGVRTKEEAAQLIFELESAGALKERAFFSKLSTLDDAAKIAWGAGLLRSTLGGRETGSFQAITSKAIAAAGPVTGVSPSDILAGAARAGESGRALGLSDEEILAATSIAGQTTGSGQEAGTLVNSLFRSLVKQGYADKYKGKGLGAMLRQVESLGLNEQKLIEFFGRQEAGTAFGLLKDQGRYGKRLQAIQQAQATDLAGQMIATAFSDPNVMQGRRSLSAQAREALSAEGLGFYSAKLSERLSLQRAADRAAGIPEWQIQAGKWWEEKTRTYLGDPFVGSRTPGIGSYAQQGGFSAEDHQKAMMEYQKRQADTLDRIDKKITPAPATGQRE